MDPDADLEVSAHHAMLFSEGVRWYVRDLDSRNGTFLDGVRIAGDEPVSDGSTLQLGSGGPVLALALESTSSDTHGLERNLRSASPASEMGSAHERLAREHRVLWSAVALLAVTLVGVTVTLLVRNARERAGWARERAELTAYVDSVLLATEASAANLGTHAADIGDTLQAAREEIRRLRTELSAESGNGGEVADLQRRLEAATAALTDLEDAANIDWLAIRERITPNVARLFVETDAGQMEMGTGFLVDDRVLVTAGHLLVGADGQRVIRRIAVQIPGLGVTGSGTILAVAPAEDLALIRAQVATPLRPVPLNARPDTLTPGGALAWVGFPGGTSATEAPSPLSSAGTLRGVSSERLEIQGYSERGASGSPVLDAAGTVVGLLRGARTIEEHRVLVAVPSTRIIELLRRR